MWLNEMLVPKFVLQNQAQKTLTLLTKPFKDWINNPVDTHYIIGSAIGPPRP
jgi:tryptophan synthase beta chain